MFALDFFTHEHRKDGALVTVFEEKKSNSDCQGFFSPTTGNKPQLQHVQTKKQKHEWFSGNSPLHRLHDVHLHFLCFFLLIRELLRHRNVLLIPKDLNHRN